MCAALRGAAEKKRRTEARIGKLEAEPDRRRHRSRRASSPGREEAEEGEEEEEPSREGEEEGQDTLLEGAPPPRPALLTGREAARAPCAASRGPGHPTPRRGGGRLCA
ncbi:unnamed protein product, partial [Prorocentrum cordatum]